MVWLTFITVHWDMLEVFKHILVSMLLMSVPSSDKFVDSFWVEVGRATMIFTR